MEPAASALSFHTCPIEKILLLQSPATELHLVTSSPTHHLKVQDVHQSTVTEFHVVTFHSWFDPFSVSDWWWRIWFTRLLVDNCGTVDSGVYPTPDSGKSLRRGGGAVTVWKQRDSFKTRRMMVLAWCDWLWLASAPRLRRLALAWAASTAPISYPPTHPMLVRVEPCPTVSYLGLTHWRQ